jgi:type IV pilus assembly protein PilM
MHAPAAWYRLTSLLKDPPPEYLFELSEAGIAFARNGKRRHIGFLPLEPGVLAVSPLRDNIQQPDALAAQVRSLASDSSARKRRRAALVLPDYCGRVTVLDFDAFPSEPAEQLSLVRFRIRKTVPFDVESAVVQYYVQPRDGKRLDVVVGVIAMEIVARYEAPFRAAGFQPGLVITSTLATLGMMPRPDDARHGIRLLAKLTGRVLTVSVLEGAALKVIRCVELAEVSSPEINSILYPTMVYVEDELAARPAVLLLCGFEVLGSQARAAWEAELGLPVELLQSRYGAPGQHRAGLLGLVESLEEF